MLLLITTFREVSPPHPIKDETISDEELPGSWKEGEEKAKIQLKKENTDENLETKQPPPSSAHAAGSKGAAHKASVPQGVPPPLSPTQDDAKKKDVPPTSPRPSSRTRDNDTSPHNSKAPPDPVSPGAPHSASDPDGTSPPVEADGYEAGKEDNNGAPTRDTAPIPDPSTPEAPHTPSDTLTKSDLNNVKALVVLVYPEVDNKGQMRFVKAVKGLSMVEGETETLSQTITLELFKVLPNGASIMPQGLRTIIHAIMAILMAKQPIPPRPTRPSQLLLVEEDMLNLLALGASTKKQKSELQALAKLCAHNLIINDSLTVFINNAMPKKAQYIREAIFGGILALKQTMRLRHVPSEYEYFTRKLACLITSHSGPSVSASSGQLPKEKSSDEESSDESSDESSESSDESSEESPARSPAPSPAKKAKPVSS